MLETASKAVRCRRSLGAPITLSVLSQSLTLFLDATNPSALVNISMKLPLKCCEYRISCRLARVTFLNGCICYPKDGTNDDYPPRVVRATRPILPGSSVMSLSSDVNCVTHNLGSGQTRRCLRLAARFCLRLFLCTWCCVDALNNPHGQACKSVAPSPVKSAAGGS